MEKKEWNFNTHSTMASSYMFEPTVSIFDKSVVFCYQKVGTRFFLFLSNWPKSINQTYNQYHINIAYESTNDLNLRLNTEFNEYSTWINFLEEHKNSCYGHESFLQKNEGNMNNFFFNNSKDLYFVIRDPLERFLSGITQVASSYISEMIMQEDEKIRIKKFTNLTNEQIENIYKNYNHYFNSDNEFSEQNMSNIDLDIFTNIVMYIIKYRAELYIYDAHTQNYLQKYKEFIYNIKNKNKVKIIDLKDCKKDSAIKLFNTWSDTIDYTSAFENTNGHIVSNKKLYKYIISKMNSDDSISQSLYFFLVSELKEYNELRRSKYFLNL